MAFADLVTAQQALTTSVTTYLGLLGQLWTSVVSVADPQQTDDLFQFATAQPLPPIPDLDHLLPLPCEHDCPARGTRRQPGVRRAPSTHRPDDDNPTSRHLGFGQGEGVRHDPFRPYRAAARGPGWSRRVDRSRQTMVLPAAREVDMPSPSPFTVPGPPAAVPLLTPPAPPMPTFAPAPQPGPYFEVDPLLDRPPLPPPGWFADVDLGAVIPHVKNHLSGQVQLPGAANADTVALPSAGLDWTVFPRVEAGYRLPSGFGAVSLSFRFLDTEGTSTVGGVDGAAVLHSRLSLHEAGLDYSNNETSLWPNWDMKWTVGVRLLYAFFDSRADESPAASHHHRTAR